MFHNFLQFLLVLLPQIKCLHPSRVYWLLLSPHYRSLLVKLYVCLTVLISLSSSVLSNAGIIPYACLWISLSCTNIYPLFLGLGVLWRSNQRWAFPTLRFFHQNIHFNYISSEILVFNFAFPDEGVNARVCKYCIEAETSENHIYGLGWKEGGTS